MTYEIFLIKKQLPIIEFGTRQLVSKAKQAMDIPIDIAWLTNCYGSYIIIWIIARLSSHHQSLAC